MSNPDDINPVEDEASKDKPPPPAVEENERQFEMNLLSGRLNHSEFLLYVMLCVRTPL